MRTKRTFPAGQYSNPLRVVSFNADEGWPRGISAEVATEVRRRCDLEVSEVPAGIQGFMEMNEGPPPYAAGPKLSRLSDMAGV